jgi:hypothetical protein
MHAVAVRINSTVQNAIKTNSQKRSETKTLDAKEQANPFHAPNNFPSPTILKR